MNREKILDIVMLGIHYYYEVEMTKITRKEYERISKDEQAKTIIKKLILDSHKEMETVQKYVKENLK